MGTSSKKCNGTPRAKPTPFSCLPISQAARISRQRTRSCSLASHVPPRRVRRIPSPVHSLSHRLVCCILIQMPWSELWKTLLSAGLGFLGGLLAEPVRMAITDRVKRRQMRRAMYWDAYRSYWDLVQFVYKGRNADVSGKEARSAMQRYVRDDLLEHYHKAEQVGR